MSAVLIGNLPQGKLLVTDSMVASPKKVNSYRDCKLKDKICRGYSTHGYYSLVGDETILYGLQALDNWIQQYGGQFDFTEQRSFERALEVASKLRKTYKATGFINKDHRYPDQSYVYLISAQKAMNYNVVRREDSFHIEECKSINLNEIILNYGGQIHPVKEFIFENKVGSGCINVASEYLQEYHAHLVAFGRPRLDYDFEDRFCGVLMPPEGSEVIKLPFRNFDEYLITIAGGGWDLIDAPPF